MKTTHIHNPPRHGVQSFAKRVTLTLLILTLFTAANISNADILYKDDFSRQSTMPVTRLHWSAPTSRVADKYWTGLGDWKIRDGKLRIMTYDPDQYASLPFHPQQGFIYKVSADIRSYGSSNSWIGLGFFSGNRGRLGHHSSTIVRINQQIPSVYYFKKIALDPALRKSDSVRVALILDTTEEKWSTKYLVNEKIYPGERFTYVSNPKIKAVGFSKTGSASAVIDNFTLQILSSPK